MRMRKIDAAAIFPKIEFELVTLIFDTVLIKYLVHLAGVIVQGFKLRLHVLNDGEKPILINLHP